MRVTCCQWEQKNGIYSSLPCCFWGIPTKYHITIQKTITQTKATVRIVSENRSRFEKFTSHYYLLQPLNFLCRQARNLCNILNGVALDFHAMG